MNYAIRLQALDGYAAKFNDVFSDRFSRCIYVHHTGKKGDNPHYHFCVTCDYNKDALRKEFKKHFNLAKGNKHISIKDWDGSPRACSYLFHENTSVTNVRGFTDEEYNGFFQLNKDVKEKHVKLPDIIDEAVKRMCDQDPWGKPVRYKRPQYEFVDMSGEHSEHKQCFNILLDIIQEKSDWVPNKFQFERYINRVLFIVNSLDESGKNMKTFRENLYGQYFGRL